MIEERNICGCSSLVISFNLFLYKSRMAIFYFTMVLLKLTSVFSAADFYAM